MRCAILDYPRCRPRFRSWMVYPKNKPPRPKFLAPPLTIEGDPCHSFGPFALVLITVHRSTNTSNISLSSISMPSASIFA